MQLFGLGLLGFDHLQIVFQSGSPSETRQEDWFVIEGLREEDGVGVRLAVEGWHGGTTLSDANGGLVGADLARRIGTSASRGAQEIADGSEAVSLWAKLVSFAADIEAQRFPYIPMALPASPLPTINSSSLVASLLHHAGVDVERALPAGLRFSPGMSTLLGTSGDDTLKAERGFSTLVGGGGDDVLVGSDAAHGVDKLYGGAGNDTFRWSHGTNIIHGGQPGLSYADDGIDTVDYSGVGALTIHALPPGISHGQPDFIVTHARGQDYLFSIEEIVWDAARDRVTLGTGVGLAPPDAGAERGLSGVDLGFLGPGAFDDPMLDGLCGRSEASLFDFAAGG
ncbi:hypothetical protein [Hyphomicrobium sp.]|uniref:hypothetical protein n=1 Tax=Hyphomicrobium sp. TaxID=82 RepID=UPI0025BD1B79|nr:hypothetical protein [Hyphomicrobium sp.]MCC7254071.1 hypothetical protein [Hyphomicrobium sp.]